MGLSRASRLLPRQHHGAALNTDRAPSEALSAVLELLRLERTGHDTCTAQCHATWDLSEEGRTAGWQALATAPVPVGYDPSIIPGWDAPSSPTFGILRLRPWRLHVMPGAVMLQGQGAPMSWQDGD